MRDLSTIVMQIVSGHGTTAPELAYALIAFSMLAVVGKIIGEFVFDLLPMRTKRREIAALKTALLRERNEHDETKVLSERYRQLALQYIERTNAAEWRCITIEREKRELAQRLDAIKEVVVLLPSSPTADVTPGRFYIDNQA